MMFLAYLRYYNSRYDDAENIGVKFDVINRDGKTYLSTRKNESEVGMSSNL